MASFTFMAGSQHITVRTRKEVKPTGLAAVSWKEGSHKINVRVNGITHKDVGMIEPKGEGFYFYIGAINNTCGFINTYKAKQPFKSVEVALVAVAAWIKMEVKRLENASNSGQKFHDTGDGKDS